MNRNFLMMSTSLWATANMMSDQGSGSGGGSPAQQNKPAEAPKPADPAAKSTTAPAGGATPSGGTQAKTTTQPTHTPAKHPEGKSGTVTPLHKPGQGSQAKKPDHQKGKTNGKKAEPEKKGRGDPKNADAAAKLRKLLADHGTMSVQALAGKLGITEKKVRSAIDGSRALSQRAEGKSAGVKWIYNVGRNMFSYDKKAGAAKK